MPIDPIANKNNHEGAKVAFEIKVVVYEDLSAEYYPDDLSIDAVYGALSNLLSNIDAYKAASTIAKTLGDT